MAKTGLIGKKDDSNVQSEGVIETIADLGELAARLGSIVTYKRSGNVLALEDFSYGVNRIEQWLGSANASIVPVNYPTLSKGVACYLKTGTTTSDDCAIYIHYLAPQEVGVGWEFAWSNQGRLVTLYFDLQYYDGSHLYQFEMYFTKATGTLKLYPKGGTWATVDSGMKVSEDADAFNVWKLIIDLDEKKYNRLYCNNVVYDLSDYEVYSNGDTSPVALRARIYVVTSGSAPSGIVIDNLILTQNEELPTC